MRTQEHHVQALVKKHLLGQKTPVDCPFVEKNTAKIKSAREVVVWKLQQERRTEQNLNVWTFCVCMLWR